MHADLFAAGPCFDAGRYGMSAGALCAAVQEHLGIPAIAAMSEENPGVDLYRESLHIVDSGTNAARTRDVIAKMAHLGNKLVAKEKIGLPAEEGYLARGLLRDQLVEKRAATRMVDMLLAKMKGEKFESEMTPTTFAPVAMPAAIKDMSKAKVMMITDGGLVPKGNPDRIQGTAATNFGAYDIAGQRRSARARITKYRTAVTTLVSCSKILIAWFPSMLFARWKKTASIGKLHDEFLSTCGRSNPLSNTRRLGREMAAKAKREGVDAVILTST